MKQFAQIAVLARFYKAAFRMEEVKAKGNPAQNR